MGRRGRGRQQAWGRGVENGSLVFCADFRPDVEVSHGWVPDLGGPGRGVTLPNRATPGPALDPKYWYTKSRVSIPSDY